MKRQTLRKLLIFLSFLLFPITLFYFSPYLIIQGGSAGIITGSFMIFVALFLFSLFFGRAFCGWLCPSAGLQESCFRINDKRLKNKKADQIKYWIWAFWLMGIIAAFITAGGIHSVDFFYLTDHGVSASGLVGLMTYFGIITLITILALVVGKRGMCHTICWMAPFMVLGTKLSKCLHLPSLHLQPNSDHCINCKICTGKCPMSLNVHTMVAKNNMTNSECILCGECADSCPKKAISLTFHK
jgi:Polyferredoxin